MGKKIVPNQLINKRMKRALKINLSEVFAWYRGQTFDKIRLSSSRVPKYVLASVKITHN